MGKSMLKRIQHGGVVIIRLRHCSKGGTVIAVIKELVNLHRVKPFFFGLHQEKVSKPVQALTGTISGHCQVYMGGIKLKIHLFIECLH
ncbi:hypothetical protein D3C71_1967660 [compost metagenome]